LSEFSFEAFRKTKFSERTGTVDLANFGDTEAPVVWHIRGLDAVDMAVIEDSAALNRSISTIIDSAAAAAGGDPKAQADTVKEALGIGQSVPAGLVREYVIFELGSIEPTKPRDRQDVIKFAKIYPVEFKRVVREIMALTGLGGVAKKKPMPYGQDQTSGMT